MLDFWDQMLIPMLGSENYNTIDTVGIKNICCMKHRPCNVPSHVVIKDCMDNHVMGAGHFTF